MKKYWLIIILLGISTFLCGSCVTPLDIPLEEKKVIEYYSNKLEISLPCKEPLYNGTFSAKLGGARYLLFLELTDEENEKIFKEIQNEKKWAELPYKNEDTDIYLWGGVKYRNSQEAQAFYGDNRFPNGVEDKYTGALAETIPRWEYGYYCIYDGITKQITNSFSLKPSATTNYVYGQYSYTEKRIYIQQESYGGRRL